MNNSTKYSHKHLSDYPTNESGSTIFLQPTCKEEISNTISSLNSNKASGSTLRLKFWYKIQIDVQIDDVARKGSGQPKSKVEEMFLSKMNKISLEFILDSRNCT